AAPAYPALRFFPRRVPAAGVLLFPSFAPPLPASAHSRSAPGSWKAAPPTIPENSPAGTRSSAVPAPRLPGTPAVRCPAPPNCASERGPALQDHETHSPAVLVIVHLPRGSSP